MDPFTTILRALIGKKVVEGASDAATKLYNENKETADNLAQGFNSAAGLIGKEALPALAASTLLPGGLGTGILLQQGIKAKKTKDALNKELNKSDYDKIVDIAQKSGYTPSDAEVDTFLQNIRNRNNTAANSSPNIDVELETEPKAETKDEDEGEVIEYTYKPGDTFGQVLLNLGLSDGSNLWGSGGDVEFYTEQLKNQNMLDSRGNVKLGIPFKLRRRK